MKTITLEEAYDILEECSAVIVDSAVSYPGLADLSGDDYNEFLYINWQDDEYLNYAIRFTEGENRSIKVSGSSMFLVDHEGDETQITILEPKQLEK
jgi:hypothetical protein